MPADRTLRPLVWSDPGRTTLEIATGAWRTRRPAWIGATAPCRVACPAGEPIADWVGRATAGDWGGAWRTIRAANPLPAVTGRVCGHPCERACNRAAWDGAVAINALERFVGDWGLEHGVAEPGPLTSGARIAVIGGGPAGLSCAYHARRLGYGVTLFEREAELGGMLRYGIPAYRLPRAVLDREIALLVAEGIDVRTRRALGTTLGWDDLAAFDAVFLAPGAAVGVRLGVPGDTARRVHDAVGFLHAVNEDLAPRLGERLAVVGGGSTAMDVARSARRLGVPDVVVLALETRADMPALPDEVEQADAEGVRIFGGIGVRAIRADRDTATGVVISAARLERTAAGGVRARFTSEERVVVQADDVVVAIGQRPAQLGLPADPSGLLAVDGDGATAQPRTWAGGDAASARRTVADAIGAGARAARAIHARLTAAWAGVAPGAVVTADAIRRHHFASAARAARWQRSPHERVGSFAEVTGGLTERAAHGEAARCLSCGRCVGCDVCLEVCPDVAIGRAPGGYTLSTEHCKGCGLCSAECPRGALPMVAEA